jgi:hypothetical protein
MTIELRGLSQAAAQGAVSTEELGLGPLSSIVVEPRLCFRNRAIRTNGCDGGATAPTPFQQQSLVSLLPQDSS